MSAGNQTLEEAISHHQSGRLAGAEELYRQILLQDPNHVVALHLLGVIITRQGDAAEAVDLIARAVALKPDYAEAHFHLGLALRKNGRLGDAVASLQQAIALKPDYVQASTSLGDAFGALGQLDDAVASYRRALELMPEYAIAHNNLGVALQKLGMQSEAAACHRQALTIDPTYAEAFYNLGDVLAAMGDLDAAISTYHQALPLQPDNPHIHNNLANALRAQGKLDEAAAGYREAIALAPDFAMAHNNLGAALEDIGLLDQAIESFGDAIRLDPDYGEAHRHRAHLKRHVAQDDDVTAMQAAYAKPGIAEEQKMHLAFGLGKAFDDLGQYEAAFPYFADANALKRKQYSYAVEDQAAFFDNLKAVFDATLFAAHPGSGSDDTAPIFIIGMPRSGTTLVEQILASHPRVHGAGELDLLPRIISAHFDAASGDGFPGGIPQAGPDDFQQIAADYTEALRSNSTSSHFITDKLPSNYFNVGIIKLALPNAKVIHCVRDPIDTGLSLFKSYFPSAGHYYAYDQREIARYYGHYHGLMAHWRRVLPGFVRDIRYEDIIEDQIESTRTLLNWCGLEWDDACLDFHRTERPVRTASAEQVRQPLYRTSVKAWKRYEKPLAPMIEELRARLGAEIAC